MSSESEGDGREKSFEGQLQNMYERYRRRDLEDRLEDVADTMEATILQQALAEALFDATIEIDREAKEAVDSSLNALEREDYEQVEENFDELESRVEEEQTRVSNEIQKLRLDRLDTVRAMRRLNERVEEVDSMRLEALEQLLDDWNWKGQVYTETASSLSDRRSEAVEYGEDMADIFEKMKQDLFGPYKGSDLWPLVESLLDEERLTYGDLTSKERDLLAESDLAAYVELSLS